MSSVRSNAPGLVVGLCFMALGVLLLGDRMGLVNFERALALWPLALMLLGVSLIVQSMRGRDEGARRGFPVGALIWLAIIGFFLTNFFERRGSADPAAEPGRIKLFAVLGGDKRSSPAVAFEGAEMTSFLGGTVLDLRDARLEPGQEATIDVFAMMGGAVVHVPRHWIVDLRATAVMGGVEDERFAPENEEPRRRGPGGMRRPRGLRGTAEGPQPPEPWDDMPGPPALPGPPELPEPPDLDRRTAPATPPDQAPVEREDPVPASAAPRLVLRGFVMMGGLVVKS